MLGLFGELAPQLKTVANKVRFDSVVNRLHYRVTSGFLLVCCILVCATEFIGAPIQCIVEGGPGQFGKAVNTYCWIASTYTLPEHYDKTVGLEVPHPGVGPYNPDRVEKKYHAYYQWVPFVLLFQAILFYAPHFLWRNWESKELCNLLGDLASRDVVDNGDKHDRYRPVAKYLIRTKGHHVGMFWKFMLCEILNFVMVVGNIAFTDVFLGGEFRQYGAQVIEFMGQDDLKRTDPLTKVFPRVTKCDWHQYGPSGSIQKYDALCVLAINIINEKIYVFLWFWFVLLAAITGIWLIVRAIMVVIPGARRFRLQRLVGARGDHSWAVRSVVDKVGIADWFVVLGIGDHMDPLYYPGFVAELAEGISNPAATDAADGMAGGNTFGGVGANLGKIIE